MIRAILLDLDNTLIENPPFQFVRRYIDDMTAYLHERFPQVSAEAIEHAHRTAIRNVIIDVNPLTLNIEVFREQFSMLSGLDGNEFREPFASYYRDYYPSLQLLTRPKASAPILVEWLLDHQYDVAIATNPLFESEPVAQRLSWAGLDPVDWPFTFVSSLNVSHYTKPHPMYYEEILARVGVEPEETLMVGDDWQNDILPATMAGLNTFWIAEPGQSPPTDRSLSSINANGRGTLDDLCRLITKEDWLNTLQPRPLSIEQIAPRMLGNVAALMGLVVEVPPHYWDQRPDPEEWSPLEIVTHLRDSETQLQRPRLQRIANEDNPFLSAPNPPPIPGQMEISATDGQAIALDFAHERDLTLRFLAELDASHWHRPARHSVLGPTSLLEMAAFTTRHDHLHITQLCQTLGNCE
jgi:FMN phosphatase YigB (HAD superfamily)